MNIKDCKFGTRVICANPDCENAIPVGAVGTIIENDTSIPWVSFDENYGVGQGEVFGYSNCKVMELNELVALEENPSEGTNLGKLTVSLATEDRNEIAKDILRVVLQGLCIVIENISKDLDEDEVGGNVTPKEPVVTEQDVLDNLLYCINSAVDKNDEEAALKLSEAYQRIKSVQMI